MLEAAYESDEITSYYLEFICFSVSKCKTFEKAKKIVIEKINEQKQKAKSGSITSISMDSAIPRKVSHKK